MARRDPRDKDLWIGDSRVCGFPRKQKGGFRSEDAAQQWEKERRMRLLNPELALILSKISKACLEYLEDCKRRNMGHNTIRHKVSVLKQFCIFVGPDLLLKEIRTFHIRQFLNSKFDILDQAMKQWESDHEKKRKKPIDPGKCCNRYKRELVSLFNFFKRDQIIATNPAIAVTGFDENSFEKYVPPGEDIDAIKEVANQDELDIIRTLIHTGARAGEIRNMRFKDYDEKTKKLTLWTTKRQGSKKVSHVMEISQSLHDIIIRRLDTVNSEWIFPNPDGGQMPKDSIDNIMPRLCNRVIDNLKAQGDNITFKPFTMHSIRHYMAAQIFVRKGLAKTQAFLRHRRATTTDIYIRSIMNIETISEPITDDIEESMKPADIQSKITPLFKG